MEYTNPNHPSYSALLFGAPGSVPTSSTPSASSASFDSSRNSPYAFTDFRNLPANHRGAPAASNLLVPGGTPLIPPALLPSYYPDAPVIGGPGPLSCPTPGDYLGGDVLQRSYGQDDGVPYSIFSAGSDYPFQPEAVYSRSTPAGPSRHSLDGSSLGMGLTPPTYAAPMLDSLPSSGASPALGPPTGARPWVPQERGPWREPAPDQLNMATSSQAGSESGTGRGPSHPPQSSRGSTAYSRDGPRSGPSARRQTAAESSTFPNGGGGAPHEQAVPRSFSLGTVAPATSGSDIAAATDYPKSSTYPENLYDEVLPEGTSWEGGRQISSGDCGQALATYEHLLSAVPHLRPIRPGIDGDLNTHPASPSSLRPLYELASEGVALLNGSAPHDQLYDLDGLPQIYDRQNDNPAFPYESGPPGGQVLLDAAHSRQSLSAHGNSRRGGRDKSQTQCLGCGATETPEWRRGPMGPRTLCNACGLVHMKLQRKRKKQEEKAAAAAEEGEQAKGKKVKQNEGG